MRRLLPPAGPGGAHPRRGAHPEARCSGHQRPRSAHSAGSGAARLPAHARQRLSDKGTEASLAFGARWWPQLTEDRTGEAGRRSPGSPLCKRGRCVRAGAGGRARGSARSSRRDPTSSRGTSVLPSRSCGARGSGPMERSRGETVARSACQALPPSVQSSRWL